MNALPDLQQKLNSDAALRAQFMKEPGSLLRSAGLKVFPEQAKKLTKSLRSLTSRQSIANTPGIIIIQIDGR
ncbi:MAG TPA: hypothetical protein VHA33_21805 [Candidatus Angelobacter sp.]|jgi:hypothetical protein|nr:hypothetical protein [Candidatus Angelobacter sp.]